MTTPSTDDFESYVYEVAKREIDNGKLTRTLVIFEYITQDGGLRYGMLHPKYMTNSDTLSMLEEAMMQFFPGQSDDDDF